MLEDEKDETQQQGTFPKCPEGQALDLETKTHLEKAGMKKAREHLMKNQGNRLCKGVVGGEAGKEERLGPNQWASSPG